ncbi:unnamed protein product [Caenorhabditis brenneri]
MNQSKKDSIGKSNEKKRKNAVCKRVEEVGIPTVFTPVPSVESCLADEQSRLRRLREPAPPSQVTSDLSSQKLNDSTDSTVKKPWTKGDCSVVDTRKSTMVLIKVYFMQNSFTSFELATDRTLLVLLRCVLNEISKEIRNKFSFYVFASPYDVIWKRPRCELMKKPPSSSIFRYMLTPSQMNMTLSELFSDVKLEGLENMNIYIFIKNMEEVRIKKIMDSFNLLHCRSVIMMNVKLLIRVGNFNK